MQCIVTLDSAMYNQNSIHKTGCGAPLHTDVLQSSLKIKITREKPGREDLNKPKISYKMG